VRWPERELIFEDGTGAELVAPRLREPVALRSAR